IGNCSLIIYSNAPIDPWTENPAGWRRVMVRFVTVRRFAYLSGYTENAIRSKIRDGIWRQGEQWVRAPDSRVLIDVVGYERWVESVSATTLQTQRSAALRDRPHTGSPPPLK